MNILPRIFTAALACGLPLILAGTARAEEGGSAHYMPGAAASFIDTLPGRPCLAAVNLFTYYNGEASGGRTLPLGGLVTAGLEATAYADTIAAIYETPLRLLGGYYAAGAAIPYVWMEVEGNVTAGPITGNRRDTANGIGDIQIIPFMIGWTNGPDLKYDTRLSIYAPSGDYDVGALANVGKNYWTFEPAVSFSWLSTKIGTEFTIFAGVDFNTENEDTDYQSGTSLHLDGTLAQHLPLLGGIVGAGANGFYYEQLEGDSGSGATLGDFESRTVGVGPVVSYVRKIGKLDFAAEVKWLPELDVAHRVKGDYIWFKLALIF